MPEAGRIDALLPPEMAERAIDVGVRKDALPWPATFVLAVLAGAFISLGAISYTTVLAGAQGVVPLGLARLVAGLAFSLGLFLVVVGGAELFTGNNLLVMAWASRRLPALRVLRNWGLVYVGNAVGAVGTAVLVFLAGQYGLGQGAVGAVMLSAAAGKLGHGVVAEVASGVLCNTLVCLAVWLSYSARSTTDRFLAVVPPITAFVLAGFEHSIANMYFFAVALLVKHFAPAGFWAEAGLDAHAYPELTVGAAVVENLLPVTLGNVIGGGVLVGLVYAFVYLRRPATR